MSLTITNSFTPGTKARAGEVNQNFADVSGKFTTGAGGIDNSDIYNLAGIEASKLSGIAGQRITQAQMDDDAVDDRVLKDGPGGLNAAVATANHIRDGIITPAKIVAGSIAVDRLKIHEVTQNFVINVGTGAVGLFKFQLLPAPALPAMAVMFPVRLTVEGYTIAGGVSDGISFSLVENLALTVFYFGIYHVSTGTPYIINGTVRFAYLDLT